ncbi:MAG: hypothetical protein PF487_11490 [Bacteroidales bacterium]|jgi:hypothetical protein|nr:hypothetical protein [Bacteroidales bacterium]
MKNEIKILFENIKNFRKLITEGVSDDVIKKAIENHEWIYLYYDAGDDEGKNASGYRTVRPYVLGKNSAGNTVLRAWQDNPKNSWHFNNRATRPDSQGHDYWSDQEGVKPGWRMFNVDKITKIYPTGKKFNDNNGLPMIPAGYHEGDDDDMTSIVAYVSTKKDLDYKYDKDQEIDVIPKKDRNIEKWNSIRRGNKNSKQITADDVVKLRDIASRVYKKRHGDYLVVIDNKNNFQLIQMKDKEKQNIPDIAVVGSLPYLYDSLVNKNAPSDDKFFNDMKNKTQTDLRLKAQDIANQPESEKSGVDFENMSSMKETNNPEIPYKKMTFFK